MRSWRRPLTIGAGISAIAVGVVWFTSRDETTGRVIVPELSAIARAGKQAFDTRCAQCHGEDARGGAKGPPLVHRTYHPALHADVAFDLAIQRGVRAHHWRFGDMPAQPEVSSAEVSQITSYVRELQQANGIY